jgi:hypothetical protein
MNSITPCWSRASVRQPPPSAAERAEAWVSRVRHLHLAHVDLRLQPSHLAICESATGQQASKRTWSAETQLDTCLCTGQRWYIFQQGSRAHAAKQSFYSSLSGSLPDFIQTLASSTGQRTPPLHSARAGSAAWPPSIEDARRHCPLGVCTRLADACRQKLPLEPVGRAQQLPPARCRVQLRQEVVPAPETAVRTLIKYILLTDAACTCEGCVAIHVLHGPW